jgi:hypothetical protein
MKEYPTLADVLKRHGLDAERIIVRDGDISADFMHQMLNINFRCVVMPELKKEGDAQ